VSLVQAFFQVCVPEFNVVISGGQERAVRHRHHTHVVDHEAREQVAVKGEKEFLEVTLSVPTDK